MKKLRKLSLKKINVARINSTIGSKAGGTLDSIIDCPITMQVHADGGCFTTDALGSRDRQNCNANCA